MKREVVPAGQGDPAPGPEPQLAPAPQDVNTAITKRSIISIIMGILTNIPQVIQIIMSIVRAFKGNREKILILLLLVSLLICHLLLELLTQP